MIAYLKKNDTPLYIASVILLLPALFINLGYLPFFIADDEATRALVALEMIIRDQYSFSTLNGQFYYFKPPLFNWFVALFFNISGSYSEYVARIPNVIGLILFGLSIFLFARKHYNTKQAAIISLAFITSGRMLFWESFMCLIDITFSFLVFTVFMVIYHFNEKGKYYSLFIYAYILTALAFLMKGLPALVFLGITLLVFFIYTKRFRYLLRGSHFIGILIFLIIIGAYYANYLVHNPNLVVLNVLWTESTGRITDYTFFDVIIGFLKFPVDMWYHFLPWTLLIIFFIKKGFWKEVFRNPFMKYCFLILIFNIIPYWIAPGVYPRYILMLIPLFFFMLFAFYFKYKDQLRIQTRIFDIVFLIVLILLSISFLAFPFWEKTSAYPMVWFRSIILFVLLSLVSILYIKLKNSRLILIILALIISRIAFDLFIWPQRLPEVIPYKEDAVKITEISDIEDLEILYWDNLHHGLSFYLTKERDKVLFSNRLGENIIIDKYYIIDTKNLNILKDKGFNYNIFYKFNAMDEWHPVYLIKFSKIPDEDE